jgi:hypothetical protein
MTATLIESTPDLPLLASGNTIPVRAEPVEASDQRQRILSSSKEKRAHSHEFRRRSTPS